MKSLKNIHFLLIYLALFFCSCYKGFVNENGNTIHGTGDLVSQNLSLTSFSKITLVGQAKITVSYGETQSVVLRAQQNIIDVLDIHSSGNNLSIGIKDNNSIQTEQGIYVDVVCPQAITDVNIVGSGDVVISGNDQDSFNATITGAGNIDAYDLKVKNCSIVITGAGNGNLNVTESLNVTISGVGTVTYKGHPAIAETISGVGSVKNGN